MKNRYLEVTASAAFAFALCAGCGGEARQSAADAGAGAGNAPDASAPDAHAGSGGAALAGACGSVPIPKEQRATERACPVARGSVQLPDMTACTIRTYITCTKDADCTAGQNGRCFANDPCNTVCSYDECLADSDCAVGPCHCRSSNSDSLRNECLPGSNCKTDADCSGGCGYCSPSSIPNPAGCTIGTLTYNCHTASDECADQNNCHGGGDYYCAYDAGTARWGCGFCVALPRP